MVFARLPRVTFVSTASFDLSEEVIEQRIRSTIFMLDYRSQTAFYGHSLLPRIVIFGSLVVFHCRSLRLDLIIFHLQVLCNVQPSRKNMEQGRLLD